MRRIFKYPVLIEDRFEIMMPEGAKPLSVQVQHGRPVLWAISDDIAKPVAYKFMIIETGGSIDERLDLARWSYVGTFQSNGDLLVWHLFWLGGRIHV